MWHGLVELLWPAVCVVCDRECAGLVHAQCLDALPRCPRGAATPGSVHGLFADGPSWFRLLHQWKYKGRAPLAGLVASEMVRACPSGLVGGVLVPVPDDPARRRARGFSPTLDLARELATRAGLDLDPRLLRRAAARPSQTTCGNDGERLRNVAGSFGVGDLSRYPVSKTLILVDDQVTSGATVVEAARHLRVRGNPVVVWAAASAARAPGRLS